MRMCWSFCRTERRRSAAAAKTVGANALSEHARALESAAKEGKAALVRDGHAAAMADYDALTEAIGTAFGSVSALPEETEQTAPDPPDGGVLEFGPSDGDVLEFDPEEAKG